MPELTRWFIKAGLIYFILALLIAIGLKIPALPFLSHLTPVFYHLLVVGWITQIIMGVSHWMFPRFSKEKLRGNELLGWLTFTCLNLGLVLRIFSEPFILSHPSILLKTIVIFSAALQWSAGVLYVIHIWKRIKEKA
jgi:cbb3-type cytochrome oxidase subunit 1